MSNKHPLLKIIKRCLQFINNFICCLETFRSWDTKLLWNVICFSKPVPRNANKETLRSLFQHKL